MIGGLQRWVGYTDLGAVKTEEITQCNLKNPSSPFNQSETREIRTGPKTQPQPLQRVGALDRASSPHLPYKIKFLCAPAPPPRRK
jgi:hypothetical protein